MGCADCFIVWTLGFITCIYGIITLPFYAICQTPWVTRRKDKEPKAQAISYENGITYKSLTPISKMHIELERNKVDTMEKVFTYAIQRNGNKRCLGSRHIIAEEDEVQPNERVFKKLVLGDYIWKSYNDVENVSTFFGKGLLELGLTPKCRIAIFAETRAEWMMAAIGSFKQNITIVTLYATLGDDAVIHGLNETEVTHVITSHDLLPKFKEILNSTPAITNIVYMEDPLKKTETQGFREGVIINSFCEVISLGSQCNRGEMAPKPSDIAIIMYTSGSTGVPKGVLLSHYNVAIAMMAFADALGPVYKDDVFIAFLPLAHVLELVCEAICFLSGIPIGYSTPLTMTDRSSKIKRGAKGDTSILRPTIMASVPLILDRISKGVQEEVQAGGKVKQAVFKFFFDYKLKWCRRGYNTPIVNRIIFSKIKKLVGGRIRLIACGGAPLAPDTQEFIRTCLSAPLLPGYGLTETTACATVSVCSDKSLGRVGAPLGCCDLKLVNWIEGSYRVTDSPYPRGEILIGGDNVSLGYFNQPGATNDDFLVQDGRRWFRTGDIGEMHADGVLKIIDRKKDLVKLQYGEYVSLGKVEAEMKTCPLVDNICVCGDSSKLFTVALLVPSAPHLQALAERLGRSAVSLEVMCADPELEKAVLQELHQHGKKNKLEKFELPGAVKLLSEVWSPDSGLVTSSFKLKRKNIQQRYQNEINAMYSSS